MEDEYGMSCGVNMEERIMKTWSSGNIYNI